MCNEKTSVPKYYASKPGYQAICDVCSGVEQRKTLKNIDEKSVRLGKPGYWISQVGFYRKVYTDFLTALKFDGNHSINDLDGFYKGIVLLSKKSKEVILDELRKKFKKYNESPCLITPQLDAYSSCPIVTCAQPSTV